jgi:hypothetical protein
VGAFEPSRAEPSRGGLSLGRTSHHKEGRTGTGHWGPIHHVYSPPIHPTEVAYPFIDWEEEEEGGAVSAKKQQQQQKPSTPAAVATPASASAGPSAATSEAPQSLSLLRSLEQGQLEDEGEALRLRRARMENPMYVRVCVCVCVKKCVCLVGVCVCLVRFVGVAACVDGSFPHQRNQPTNHPPNSPINQLIGIHLTG